MPKVASSSLALTTKLELFLGRNNSVMLACSDEGLTLETSASESLYGGQFTLSTQLIKPNYHACKKPTSGLPPASYDFYILLCLF